MMLRKTLPTAVAAIAVSTMCLPTAEAAKEDLLLDFESMQQFMVSLGFLEQPKQGYEQPYEGDRVPGEIVQIVYQQGTMDFEGKELDAYRTIKFSEGLSIVSGSHTICGAGSGSFMPIEASILLRGDNAKNTLSLSTASPLESLDLSNPEASGVCWVVDEEGTGSLSKIVINYVAIEGTNKWRCAYLQDYSVKQVLDGWLEIKQPFYASYGFDDSESSNHTGVVMIPRSSCY